MKVKRLSPVDPIYCWLDLLVFDELFLVSVSAAFVNFSAGARAGLSSCFWLDAYNQ